MHDDQRSPAADTESAAHADPSPAGRSRASAIGIARAFGGAVVFAVPALMTMELWSLGFHVDELRLGLLLLLSIPLLSGLSYYAGFEETFAWRDDVLDAFVALAVGFAASALILALFSIVGPGMSPDEVVGKISIQAFPCSVGAVLAQSLLGKKSDNEEQRAREVSYGGELFHMAAGAIFLGMSLAPTEEMILIAYKLDEWHLALLAVVTLVLTHAFVYAVEIKGAASIPEGSSHRAVFFEFTIVAYAIAMLVSAYMLWSFGRIDLVTLDQGIRSTLVLAFPAAIGASAGRLIL